MAFTGNEKIDRQISAVVLALVGLDMLNILTNVTNSVFSVNLFGISLGMVIGGLLLWYAWKAFKTGKITGRGA